MTTLPYRALLLAFVQPVDRGPTLKALEAGGFAPTTMQGGGGFLGREVAVLVLGLGVGDEARAIEILHRACCTRTEYIAVPYEGTHLPLGAPVPVEVQGATLLLLDVERCEVYP
ncbi:MAG: cyclic-di-AMP receptor [Chloroflexi bacterium]|nr:cyclic-di-AMP receptor [Chloroflexota bacterium]